MSLASNIKTFPLAELLQWFSLSRKSGILLVSADARYVKLTVLRGHLANAVSNDPQRRIGQFLLSRGYIDESTLMEALNHQEGEPSGSLLGEILIRKGLMTLQALDSAIRERAQETVYDLFLLEDGSFLFDEETGIPDDFPDLNLSLDFLVLEGMRRKDDWRRFRELMPSPDIRLRAVPGTIPRMSKLSEFAISIWGKLKDNDQSPSELVMETRHSPYDVFEALYRLFEQECIDSVSEPVVLQPEVKPAPSPEEAEEELRAMTLRREFTRAWDTVDELRRRGADVAWLEKTEKWLVNEEHSYLVLKFTPLMTPCVKKELTGIRKEEISPKEAFLLSRLGEAMNIKMLSQIMPLGATEILRLLDDLERKGIIGLH